MSLTFACSSLPSAQVTINPRRLSSKEFLEDSDEPAFIVETIRSHRKTPDNVKRSVRSARQYEVVWKGYPLSEASWEPESNLCLLSEFAAYWQNQPSVPPGVQHALRARDRYLAEHPDEAD
eukprot:276936-Chlamydomonas_euryale.AAC.1